MKMVVSAASAVPGLGAVLQLLKLSNDVVGIATNSVTAVKNFIGAITAAAEQTTNNINDMSNKMNNMVTNPLQRGGMNNYKTRSLTVEKQTAGSINEFLGIKEDTINNKTRRKKIYNKTRRKKIYNKLKPKSKRIR